MSKRTVLVVEDDDGLREALQDIFSDYFRVVPAANGVEGLARFNEGGIDLVVSDVKMPKKNGIEMMKEMKSQSSIPVILMTGFSEELEAKSATDLGADGFLGKPFEPMEMVELAQAIVEKSKKIAA